MQTGLLFKKRMFRDADESIDETTFVLLSYVQAKHDFMMGNYPISRDDAALLAALQVQAEEGPRLGEDPSRAWPRVGEVSAAHNVQYAPHKGVDRTHSLGNTPRYAG